MRFLPIIAIILLIGCSKEEVEPTLSCRLAKVTVSGTGFVSQTTYTYKSDGKMDEQIRTYNGTELFHYKYSFNDAGNVARVDDLTTYSLRTYGTDGKLATITTYITASNAIQSVSTFAWANDKVTITNGNPQKPNPTSIQEYEYSNDNMIKETLRSYTGNEPNALDFSSETIYEEFDTALNPFYLAGPSRPGFSYPQSKNNPGKSSYKSISYTNPSQNTDKYTVTTYAYTYNAQNLMLTSQPTTGVSLGSKTEVTYDQCN